MKRHAAAILTGGRGKLETGTRYAWYGSTLKTGISVARTINLNRRLSFGLGDNYLDARRYWGHVLLMAQVILGYVLLGALITRLGILFTGEAPAASPTSRKRKRRSR